MAHDLHFLERLANRVSDEDQELALSLYRDIAVTRRMIELAALPDDTERVAFALSPELEGPHVIVTRDGTFVTCLGEGMSIGPWPRISRQQLGWLRGQAESERIAERLIEEQHLESTVAALERFSFRGPIVSREDYATARAMLPLMSRRYLRRAWFCSDETTRDIPALRRLCRSSKIPKLAADRRFERLHYDLCWGFAHCFGMTSLDRTVFQNLNDVLARQNPLNHAIGMANSAIVMRVAWAIGQAGAQLFSLAEHWWRDCNSLRSALGALLALLAIGLRSRALIPKILRLLDAPTPKLALPEADRTRLTQAVRIGLGKSMKPEVIESSQRDAVYKTFTCVRAAFEAPDKIPVELVRYVFLNTEWTTLSAKDVLELIDAAPLFIPAELQDFYLSPGDWGSVIEPPRADFIHRMCCCQVELSLPPIVVKAQGPGRNEPCPCGSGKKHKHCCGRTGTK